jgi:ABC-type antimicrobial peptide transport system permease subunit
VGVARDIKQDELAARPEPFAYLPYTSGAEDAALIVRTSTDEAAMLRALEAQVHALDPNVPVVEAMTLAQHIAGRVDTERGLSRLIGAFGALAVALALVGLYGVMAFIVRGRTREIGIRLAIGARREEVAREFLVEGLRLAIWGLAAGLPIALALSAVLSSSLVGVRTADPVTFSIVLAALVAVAAAAAAIPAARAARVDPLTALRVE